MIPEKYTPVPVPLRMEFQRIQRFRISHRPEDVKAGGVLRVYLVRDSEELRCDFYSLVGVPSKKLTGSLPKYSRSLYQIGSVARETGRYHRCVYPQYLTDLALYAHAYRQNAKVASFFRNLDNSWHAAVLLDNRKDTADEFNDWRLDMVYERLNVRWDAFYP